MPVLRLLRERVKVVNKIPQENFDAFVGVESWERYLEYNKNNTARRPKEVSDSHFQSEWDRIFGTNKLSKEQEEEVKKQLKDAETLAYKGTTD